MCNVENELPPPPKGWEWAGIVALRVDCREDTPPVEWYYEGRFYLRPKEPTHPDAPTRGFYGV